VRKPVLLVPKLCVSSGDPKRYVRTLPPEPVNGSLFVKRIFADGLSMEPLDESFLD
jgi:hypothetical protein